MVGGVFAGVKRHVTGEKEEAAKGSLNYLRSSEIPTTTHEFVRRVCFYPYVSEITREHLFRLYFRIFDLIKETST